MSEKMQFVIHEADDVFEAFLREPGDTSVPFLGGLVAWYEKDNPHCGWSEEVGAAVRSALDDVAQIMGWPKPVNFL